MWGAWRERSTGFAQKDIHPSRKKISPTQKKCFLFLSRTCTLLIRLKTWCGGGGEVSPKPEVSLRGAGSLTSEYEERFSGNLQYGRFHTGENYKIGLQKTEVLSPSSLTRKHGNACFKTSKASAMFSTGINAHYHPRRDFHTYSCQRVPVDQG
jgi:hypothetical protein